LKERDLNWGFILLIIMFKDLFKGVLHLDGFSFRIISLINGVNYSPVETLDKKTSLPVQKNIYAPLRRFLPRFEEDFMHLKGQ